MSRSSNQGNGVFPEPSSARATALDPLNTVRQHPEWFFRSGRFDTNEVLGLLTSEVLRESAASVVVKRDEDWIVIAAEKDWLHGDVAAFFSPQRYPNGGRNSSRVEVALTAFCRAVVTASAEGTQEIVSTVVGELPRSAIDALANVGHGRAIAFLPPAYGQDEPSAPRSAERRPSLRLVQGKGERDLATAVESFVAKRRDQDDRTS